MSNKIWVDNGFIKVTTLTLKDNEQLKKDFKAAFPQATYHHNDSNSWHIPEKDFNLSYIQSWFNGNNVYFDSKNSGSSAPQMAAGDSNAPLLNKVWFHNGVVYVRVAEFKENQELREGFKSRYPSKKWNDGQWEIPAVGDVTAEGVKNFLLASGVVFPDGPQSQAAPGIDIFINEEQASRITEMIQNSPNGIKLTVSMT